MALIARSSRRRRSRQEEGGGGDGESKRSSSSRPGAISGRLKGSLSLKLDRNDGQSLRESLLVLREVDVVVQAKSSDFFAVNAAEKSKSILKRYLLLAPSAELLSAPLSSLLPDGCISSQVERLDFCAAQALVNAILPFASTMISIKVQNQTGKKNARWPSAKFRYYEETQTSECHPPNFDRMADDSLSLPPLLCARHLPLKTVLLTALALTSVDVRHCSEGTKRRARGD
ncbi:hypothetical protein SCHPADRAFT_890799 [Schizopora paradoxa]|uniref:Uncharacterized protein n=1 Tax=Schizopora paradoxa TaxID=27342 RepID=A0A0H2S6H4_9AGAM|nr:hypothetical protein SCHPADRAFT_890799 [Schizopora paradoxa]